MSRHRRTTVILKDELVNRARELSDEKTLRGLLNACLSDWIAAHTQRALERQLRDEYVMGVAESGRVSRAFVAIDTEDWRSW